MRSTMATALLLFGLSSSCGPHDSPTAEVGQAVASSRLCGPSECAPYVIAENRAYPITIKVNDQLVHWGEYGDFDDQSAYSGTEGAVYFAPKKGGEITLVRGGIVGLTGIAVHGKAVYYTAFGPELFTPGVGDSEVGYGIVARNSAHQHSRVGILPSADPLVDTLGPSIGAGNDLYFADYSADRIYAVKLPTRPDHVVNPAWRTDGAKVAIENAGGPVDTAIEGPYVAWIGNRSGNIGIYKEGSRPEPAAITVPSDNVTAPFKVVIKDKYVYWVRNNFPGQEGQPGYLERAEKEGPRTVQLLKQIELLSPYGLAVDNDHVYWIAIDITGFAGQLLRTPVGGGETVVLKDDLAFPAAIAIDNSAIYVAECGLTVNTGRVLKFDKYINRR